MKLELAGKRVLVLGLGISGRSAANFCAARGAHVTAADERPRQALEGLDELDQRVELSLGNSLPDPAAFDLLVPSPGIAPERYASRLAGRPAWGDIELAGRALAVPVVAVTGTNGKSTTVRLIESMLRAAGLRARAAGNVGTPALSLVGAPIDLAVLEVSSFQLETIESFRPHVAVILNLSPDHLDRHGDFANYVEVKRRLLLQQQGDDIAVLNLDDPVVRELASSVKGDSLPFARSSLVERGVGFDAGCAVVRTDGDPLRLPLDGLQLLGDHNLENVLAALAAVIAVGADPQRAIAALADFRGLPHRLEVVASLGGVRFVNDSKATNAAATIRSLESFAEPVVWIAGGRDKDLDFGALADVAAGRVRNALLIGEAAPKLERSLSGRVSLERAESLEYAVRRAGQLAQQGDVVLLSPACSSFDQFASFEERGERYRNAVQELSRRGAAS